MRKTYSTGLLALCLISGGQVLEDVLTSGLSAKLMHYLRNQVLCDTSSRQKDSSRLAECKSVSLGGGRGRSESRGRLRSPLENASLEDSRMRNDEHGVDLGVQRDHDRTFTWKAHGEERWMNGEAPDGSAEDMYSYDVDIDGDNRWHGRDMRDERLKIGERNGPVRSLHDEDFDERDANASHRVKSRPKIRVNDTIMESKQPIMSPGSESRVGQGRSGRERSLTRNMDGERLADNKKFSNSYSAEGTAIEREDTDECVQECKVGCKDISDHVTAAVRAAEAEARDANAPVEAVKAAGEASAEFVKSAAMDAYENTNNEEVEFLAASRAMSTVIDAAKSIEVSRNADSVAVDLPKDEASEL